MGVRSPVTGYGLDAERHDGVPARSTIPHFRGEMRVLPFD